MTKKYTHTWHYNLAYADNSFSLYFNDRLIAILLKPSSGVWPIHATINEKMYSFSKTGLLPHSIKVEDAITGAAIGIIKMPLLPSLFSTTKFVFEDGEEFTWYSNNFFSLHWKWKKGNEPVVDAIDNLAEKQNNGIIAINEYKAGTDLLIISGFFLSLLKRSKLSMGIKGLKRRRVGFSK